MFCSCLAKCALNAIYKHYYNVLAELALYNSAKLIFYGKLRSMFVLYLITMPSQISTPGMNDDEKFNFDISFLVN